MSYNEELENDAAEAKESRNKSTVELALAEEMSARLEVANQEMGKKLKDADDENVSLRKDIEQKESELVEFGEKIQDYLADLAEATAKADEVKKNMAAAKDRAANLQVGQIRLQ